MRICFASDFHGRLSLYDQLGELVRAAQPDLLILGGDLFADGEPDDPLGTQVAFIDRVFIPRIDVWREALPGLTVACVLGNHDWLCSLDALRRYHTAGRVVLLEPHRAWQYRGHRFLGYWHTPPTPFWVKDFERLDLPEDAWPDADGTVWDPDRQRGRWVSATEHFGRHASLSAELDALPRLNGPWIFVCHSPPHDTTLDLLPTIDHPIGSRAVRAFIAERQPVCALHGHVHESPDVSRSYHDRIGRTLCINPGQTHERLYAVLFDAERPAETLRHTVLR